MSKEIQSLSAEANAIRMMATIVELLSMSSQYKSCGFKLSGNMEVCVFTTEMLSDGNLRNREHAHGLQQLEK